MVDSYEEILEKAVKRWRSKGFSEAVIKDLTKKKGSYKEARKSKLVQANNDPTFNQRAKLDSLQIEIERRRNLKEIWDE